MARYWEETDDMRPRRQRGGVPLPRTGRFRDHAERLLRERIARGEEWREELARSRAAAAVGRTYAAERATRRSSNPDGVVTRYADGSYSVRKGGSLLNYGEAAVRAELVRRRERRADAEGGTGGYSDREVR
jgi:hypothetical protein